MPYLGLDTRGLSSGCTLCERDECKIYTNELMHCHCGTNNRAPRWTFTDPCKPEVRPGAREESASPAWLAAPAMNAHEEQSLLLIFINFETYATHKKRGCILQNVQVTCQRSKYKQQHFFLVLFDTVSIIYIHSINLRSHSHFFMT